MTGDDVTVYPTGVGARIGDQLAGWLTADMVALCDLVDVTEPDVFARPDVAPVARKLIEALQAALDADGDQVARAGPG
ncbi:MAG: hypothetical protein ACRD03_01795 [Acidimicrobiales bacterium]